MLTSSAVIKPRRQPRRVVRHNRGFFKYAATLEIGGDAGVVDCSSG